MIKVKTADKPCPVVCEKGKTNPSWHQYLYGTFNLCADCRKLLESQEGPEGMTTVCGECLIQNHRGCAGLVEVNGQAEFCKCAFCAARFTRNVTRLLANDNPKEEQKA